MQVIAAVANGEEAVRFHAARKPDITLMDVRMPKMTGLEAIEHILEKDPDAKIILLTNADSNEDVLKGLRTGASGYVLKDSHHEELFRIIRLVLNGERYIPPHLAERLAQHKFQPKLSPRELQVLERMMEGKNNRAIAYDLNIAESTVKSHVKNILIKLNVNDRTQAVTEALRRGILSTNN